MADLTSPLRRSQAIAPYSDAEQFLLDNAFASPFTRSLQQAVNTDVAGTHRQQALEAQVRGDAAGQRAAEYNRQSALRRMDLPTVGPTTWDAAKETGNYGDYVQNVLGGMAGSMVKPLVGSSIGGLVGGLPGAAVGGFGGSFSAIRNAELENYANDEQLKTMSPAEQLRVTRNSAALQALPEAIMPAYLGAGGRLPGALNRVPTPLRVAGGVATEGGTEGLQDYTSQRVAQSQFPDREIDWDSVRNNAIGGLIGGGAMGVLGRHDVDGGAPAPAARPAAGEVSPMDVVPPTDGGGGSGSGGGAGPADTVLGKMADLGAAVQDRFGDDIAAAGGKAKDVAGKAKDFVSDTVDRMAEAVKTAENPGDFLSKVFSGGIEEEAAADMTGEPNPALKGLTFEETEANLARDDAKRAARAARYADELLNDPATPDSIKQRVAEMGGDYANPDNQAFVARTLVAQRGGEKIAKAVQDLIDLGKGAFAKGSEAASAAKKAVGDAATAAQDRIVKKNMQSASPAERAAFNKVIFDNLTDEAKASTFVRGQLSEVASVLMAFAAKTGDITAKDLPVLTKLANAMSMFKDPDAMVAQLIEYGAVPRDADSFLGRVKSIQNARTDIKQPNSFLYTSLTPEAKDLLTGPMLQRLAQLVDEFSIQDAAGKGDQILDGLTQAFGSKESAQAVLDFYAQQNKANVRFDPDEGEDARPMDSDDLTDISAGVDRLTEQDVNALQSTYRAPNTNRPFFRGRDDAALKTAAAPKDGGEAGLVASMRDHVLAKQGNAKLAAFDIRRDLQKRLEANVSRDTESVRGAIAALDAHLADAPKSNEWRGLEEARILRDKLRKAKTEDRSAAVKLLREELRAQDDAMEKAKRSGKDPHEALLDLYAVVLKDEDESKASDAQMTKFRELLDKAGKDPKKQALIRRTQVTFEIDGKKTGVSLESMIYNSPAKGSIKERLLASLALVAARADAMPEISPGAVVKRNYYGKDAHLTWGGLMGLKHKIPKVGGRVEYKESPEDTARKAALDGVSASNLRSYLRSLPQDTDALKTSVNLLARVERAQEVLRKEMNAAPSKEAGYEAQQLASKARVLKVFINETLDADYPIDRQTILERLEFEMEEAFDQGGDTAYKDILVAEAQMSALNDRAAAVKGTKLEKKYIDRAEEIADELDRDLSRLQPWQRMNEEDRPSGRPRNSAGAAANAKAMTREQIQKEIADFDAEIARLKAAPLESFRAAAAKDDADSFDSFKKVSINDMNRERAAQIESAEEMKASWEGHLKREAKKKGTGELGAEVEADVVDVTYYGDDGTTTTHQFAKGSRGHKEALEHKQAGVNVSIVDKAQSGTARPSVILSGKSPYLKKDQAKSDMANKFIGRGSAGSSTASYAKSWGANANVGSYDSSDRVFVSVNGSRPGALTPNFAEIKRATDAGATIIGDTPADRAREYNSGERAVADFLRAQGYVEKSPGVWVAPQEKVVKKSFIGAKADPEGEGDAADLLGVGVPADFVWRELGWFRGPDGKLRKEVRSPVLRQRVRALAKAIAAGSREATTIRDLIEGIPQFENYLDTLGGLRVDPADDVVEMMGAIGAFSDGQGFMGPGIGLSRMHAETEARISAFRNGEGLKKLKEVAGRIAEQQMASLGDIQLEMEHVLEELEKEYPMLDIEDRVADMLADTIVHELQHAFQYVEGFENGGTAATAVVATYGDVEGYIAAVKNGDSATAESIAEQAFEQLRVEVGPDGDVEAKAHELYGSITGEVEANDVAARMKLSDEEAAHVKPALMDAERRFVRSLLLTEALHTVRGMGNRQSTKKNAQRASTMNPLRGKATSVLTKDERQKIIDEVVRIRGKGVKVAFAKFADIGASGEFSMNKDKTERLIKIAISSLNPMSVAWHESLHDFMAMLGGSKAERKLKADLLNAAEAPQVMLKLRELLKGHPKALEQIETDREERLAYMYQFWAEGLLPLGPTGTGIFSRMVTFFREMLGVLSQDQKIDQLFTALHSGKFSEPSLVGAVLEDLKAQTLGDKARAVAGPIGDAAEAMFTGATDRMRNTNIEALTELADMFHREPGREIHNTVNTGAKPSFVSSVDSIGRKAAEARLAAGEDAEKVFADTKWFKDAQGKMVREIDDSRLFKAAWEAVKGAVASNADLLKVFDAVLDGKVDRLGTLSLKDVLEDMGLPHMAAKVGDVQIELSSDRESHIIHGKDKITAVQIGLAQAFDGKFSKLSAEDRKNAIANVGALTVLHEVQHVLQVLDGRADDMFTGEYSEQRGEIEAFDVEARYVARYIAEKLGGEGPSLPELAKKAPSMVDMEHSDFAANVTQPMFTKRHSARRTYGGGGVTQELPFLQRRAQQVGKRLNKLQDVLKDTTSEERRRALENMQAMKAASTPLEKELAAYLKEMHEYMVGNGVKRFDTKAKEWVDLGNVKDYFPRVWDKETIRNNEAEFIELLSQYIGEEQAHESFNALVNGDGSLELAENEHHLGFTPWNPAVLDRKFTFINASNAADFAKFQSKDMADIMTSYTQRAVHRAEYASSFGNNGEAITQKFLEAQKQGATAEELAMARKATMAMEGTLGYEFNPRLKEVMSGIMTYQNIVLLPLSLFSNLVDPLGVAMRSNDMKEAWKAFTYGIKGIADQLRGAGDDAQTEMAKTLGIIDEQNMLEAMGHVYNSMHMSRFLKNVNSKFFRYNGMEMWNQRMRVAAMMAAQRFIISHAENVASGISHSENKNDSNSYKNHSKRYLEELGIAETDVFQLQDGTIALTKDQLLQAGAKKSEVLAIEKRIQAAVFKWVDGAVLRPNAAHRPIWGSDPRYQLIFHLKQFTFSFQNTILRRVGEELKHGNVAPGWILLSYVPFMFLSDVMKGSLTGTLNTTADLYDVASQSIARSGIMGTGVFGADAMGDLERGKLPGTSFLGPAFGHLMTLLSGITGHAGVEQVVDRSVPFAKYV